MLQCVKGWHCFRFDPDSGPVALRRHQKLTEFFIRQTLAQVTTILARETYFFSTHDCRLYFALSTFAMTALLPSEASSGWFSFLCQLGQSFFNFLIWRDMKKNQNQPYPPPLSQEVMDFLLQWAKREASAANHCNGIIIRYQVAISSLRKNRI